jgi:hypothetical protein
VLATSALKDKPNFSPILGLLPVRIVSVTNPGGWDIITRPQQMIDNLVARNIIHFGQANTTPFATSPLLEIFRYSGTTNQVQQLIHQQEQPLELENQSFFVQKIIDKLSDGKNLPPISSSISYKEFVSGIKKWQEMTTTSPSGRHLGHYKILTKLNIMSDNNVNLSTAILYLYFNIVKITLLLGCTLERWCNISTCMIEKTPGVSRIDKLRVIHIFEADYNLLLKIMWARRCVWHMVKHKTINHGQYGSRPGHRAIDLVIQKEMLYTYAHLTRTNLGTIDNDAKSFYDRILCSLAMSVSQYYGLAKNICEVQAATLQKSKFKIRTALGDSETMAPVKDRHLARPSGSCKVLSSWISTRD